MVTPVPWYNRSSLTLLIALFCAFLGWVLYSVIEGFFAPTTPVLQFLFTDISLYDLILRLIVSGCFFIAGIILVDKVAAQKYREKTLSEANDILHLRTITLEQKLQEKTIEIESLLNQKNDLIIGLSHDLKTPLTPLMGFLPLIIREEKDPKLKELLTLSLRNVHYIRDLVSKAIDLALLDSTVIGLTIEKTNLLTEVDTVLDHRAVLLQRHHLIVENSIDEHLYVNVDRLKLREVLNNLVTNSITYSSPEGGTITLQATQQHQEVIVSITDTGIGMTPPQLHHIFDELYKGDDARQDHEKIGLGLSICKRIVEKHGGRIWAESPGPGKGTTVFFTVPAAEHTIEPKDQLVRTVL